MNERIGKLAEKAGLLGPGSRIRNSHEAAERFAQLIVRRTLDIVEAHTEIFQSSEAQAMVEHIKQSVKTDFGVEQ